MIPRRFRLEGFLSYREPQELSFDGAPIAMLAGPNGAGKSAVFDALTFALFGAHRGGLQNAEELITKGREALRVEFDFELNGQVYRIVRTVRREGQATRQVYRRLAEDDRWQAEPDTHARAGFDAWVRDRIGLSYSTFTSSVLLLQGGAERLISARPAERLVVLKEIVGIDRFERLHQRVDIRAKQAKQRAETVRQQAQMVPEVSDDDLDRAAAALDAAEAARTAAQARHDALIVLEQQARQAAELHAERDDLDRWFARARATIEAAEAIERDHDRLIELRATLPHLETIAEQRRRLAASDRALQAQEADRRRIEQARHAGSEERARLQERADALAEEAPRVESELNAGRARLAEAALAAERASRCRRLLDRLERLRAGLAGLPADLDAQAEALRIEVAELDAWDRALPPLSRLARARRDLRNVREALARDREDLARALDAADRLRPEFDAETERARLADAARQDARDEATRAQVARAEAIRHRQDLDGLAGQPTCDHCGQALTPEHLDQERTRRERALEAARERLQRAKTASGAANRDAERATAAREACRGRLEEADLAARSLRDRVAHQSQAAERLEHDCADAFEELASPFRLRIGPSRPEDWLATVFPTRDDLAEARPRVDRLEVNRRQLQTVETTIHQRESSRKQAEDVRRDLEAESVGLPEDLSAPDRALQAIQAELDALTRRLDAIRREESAARTALRKQDRAREQQQAALAAIERTMAVEEGRRAGYQAARESALRALDQGWRARADALSDAELGDLRSERSGLEQAGTEARAALLREARHQSAARRERLVEVRRQLEALPPEAHQEPEAIRAQLAEAHRRREQAQREGREASRRLETLRADRRRRGELDAEALGADKEAATAGRLADLLGPHYLQRHLVREAEAGILLFANRMLDDLIGGQMTLRLRKGDDDGRVEKALDLEAYHRATRQTIAVAFLSGSQRFRVAVSLALGIGRYAGRLHRPIETVIIDEGFGCLDRDGRQVMIEELRNLRAQVRRIILVSHQEEFADAFADGYRLELRDGTTIATPLGG